MLYLSYLLLPNKDSVRLYLSYLLLPNKDSVRVETGLLQDCLKHDDRKGRHYYTDE